MRTLVVLDTAQIHAMPNDIRNSFDQATTVHLHDHILQLEQIANN